MAGTVVVDTIKSALTTPPKFQNTNGTEVGQLCRAWVNFNGTGTVTIRAAFNVSSITDNGVGDYTVNFTTAMPDANYCAQVTNDTISGYNSTDSNSYVENAGALSGSLRVRGGDTNAATYYDYPSMHVAVFR